MVPHALDWSRKHPHPNPNPNKQNLWGSLQSRDILENLARSSCPMHTPYNLINLRKKKKNKRMYHDDDNDDEVELHNLSLAILSSCVLLPLLTVCVWLPLLLGSLSMAPKDVCTSTVLQREIVLLPFQF